jgi:cytochrome c556
MLINKKVLLASALIFSTTANLSIASDIASSDKLIANSVNIKAEKANTTEGSLKSVMQDLLKETQQLTAAMLNEDFTLIADTAKNIAEHPKPSMATRKKIMKAMGPKMIKFKENDDVVHGAAVKIVTNAQQKNISGVSENYKKMIDGCLSCHSMFKSEVSAILK